MASKKINAFSVKALPSLNTFNDLLQVALKEQGFFTQALN